MITALRSRAKTNAAIVSAVASQRGASVRGSSEKFMGSSPTAGRGAAGTPAAAPPPVISSPISWMSASAALNEPTIRPSYRTSMRSARARISSRSSEMSRIAVPASRRASSTRWTASIAPDVEAARRLDGDHQARAGLDLAGDDQALEVAARQQPRLGVDRWRGDRVLVLEPLGERPRRGVVDEPAAGDRRVAVALHDQVVGDRQVRRRCRPRSDPRGRARRRAGSRDRPADWRPPRR